MLFSLTGDIDGPDPGKSVFDIFKLDSILN